MTWMDDLLTRLRDDAAVKTAAGPRVAWYERGRTWKVQPSVLLNLNDDGVEYTHSGASGLLLPEMEVDVFGSGGSEVEALTQAVRSVFETDGDVVNQTKFGMGFVRTGRTMGPEDMPDGSRTFRRRMIVKFSVEQA